MIDYSNRESDTYIFMLELSRAYAKLDALCMPTHQQPADVKLAAPNARAKRRQHETVLYPYVTWYENIQGYGYWRIWDCKRRTYHLFHDTEQERQRAIALAKTLEPLRRRKRESD